MQKQTNQEPNYQRKDLDSSAPQSTNIAQELSEQQIEKKAATLNEELKELRSSLGEEEQQITDKEASVSVPSNSKVEKVEGLSQASEALKEQKKQTSVKEEGQEHEKKEFIPQKQSESKMNQKSESLQEKEVSQRQQKSPSQITNSNNKEPENTNSLSINHQNGNQSIEAESKQSSSSPNQDDRVAELQTSKTKPLEFRDRQKELKELLISEIIKLQEDFERLEERSEELKIENSFYADKIAEYESVIYQGME